MHAGYRDLRDVPEAELKNDTQRLIWRQSRLGQPFVGAELQDARARAAVPALLLGLRDDRPGRADLRRHAAVRGAAVPMVVPHRDETRRARARGVPAARPRAADARARRAVARDARHERPDRRLHAVRAARAERARRALPDLAARLAAATERIVDLHPATRRGYYHPAMQGSWSIKAVLPTVAPDLSYAKLGEVQDGLAAQTRLPRGDRREDAAGTARGLGTVAARVLPAGHAGAGPARGVLRPGLD